MNFNLISKQKKMYYLFGNICKFLPRTHCFKSLSHQLSFHCKLALLWRMMLLMVTLYLCNPNCIRHCCKCPHHDEPGTFKKDSSGPQAGRLRKKKRFHHRRPGMVQVSSWPPDINTAVTYTTCDHRCFYTVYKTYRLKTQKKIKLFLVHLWRT